MRSHSFPTRRSSDLPSDIPASPHKTYVNKGWAGVGDWRGALERFAEDRAPVYLRPNAEANAVLRSLAAGNVRIGVYTDAPGPLARIALAHLGAERRVEAVATGAGARESVVAELGGEAEVAGSADDLLTLAQRATSRT